MEATDVLAEEHRIIQHVLNALEKQARAVEDGSSVRPGFFADAADFVRNFADGCHHRKEENALFPAMVAAGVPQEGGPVGVMLAEHEQGRAFNRGMERAAREMETGWADRSRGDLVHNALGYVGLLRQHIDKENGVLFPMAERAIPAAEQDRLAAEFERIEREETGAGVHEKYHARAEALAAEAGLE